MGSNLDEAWHEPLCPWFMQPSLPWATAWASKSFGLFCFVLFFTDSQKKALSIPILVKHHVICCIAAASSLGPPEQQISCMQQNPPAGTEGSGSCRREEPGGEGGWGLSILPGSAPGPPHPGLIPPWVPWCSAVSKAGAIPRKWEAETCDSKRQNQKNPL